MKSLNRNHVQIMNMTRATGKQRRQAAEILATSLPNGWPTVEDARDEISERLLPENTLLMAVVGEEVVGWGGVLAPEYDGNVFELHPLAVHEIWRNQGIGRALVEALEEEARKQGGLTIYLGADDEETEAGETSLAHVDLYDDLPSKLKAFEAGTHQTGFYLRLGYKIIGVMPDANGVGKPDIFLGKKLYSSYS